MTGSWHSRAGPQPGAVLDAGVLEEGAAGSDPEGRDGLHQRRRGKGERRELQGSTIYTQDYVEQAGERDEGGFAYSTTALFDDFSIAEMKLYRAWLARVDPSARPDMYGVYA